MLILEVVYSTKSLDISQNLDKGLSDFWISFDILCMLNLSWVHKQKDSDMKLRAEDKHNNWNMIMPKDSDSDVMTVIYDFRLLLDFEPVENQIPAECHNDKLVTIKSLEWLQGHSWIY